MKKTSVIYAMALAGALGACGRENPPQQQCADDQVTAPDGSCHPKHCPAGTYRDPASWDCNPIPPPPPPQVRISAVNPGQPAYLGGHVSLRITAENTGFEQGATAVVFDDENVRAERVTVLSPTELEAKIAIGPADPAKPETYARIGAPKVIVITGEEAPSMEKSFAIRAPLSAGNQDGLWQGSVAPFVIRNGADGGPLPAKATMLGDGVTIRGQATQPDGSLLVTAAIDLHAAEWQGLYIKDDRISYGLPPAKDFSLRVLPRAVQELALNTSAEGSLASPAESPVYYLPMPAGPQLLSLTIGAKEDKKAPGLALLPASGRWKDELALRQANGAGPAFRLINGDDAFFAVPYAADGQLSQDYQFRLSAAVRTPVVARISPSYDADPARFLDLDAGPVYLQNMEMPGKDSYYEFTSGSDQAIDVFTAVAPSAPGHPAVKIYAAPCTQRSDGLLLAHDDGGGDKGAALAISAKKGQAYCMIVGPDSRSSFDYSLILTPEFTGPAQTGLNASRVCHGMERCTRAR